MAAIYLKRKAAAFQRKQKHVYGKEEKIICVTYIYGMDNEMNPSFEEFVEEP